MNPPGVLVVAAAVVDRLDRFDRPSRLLAARRNSPASLAGRWELPGGKVEPGEAPLDALHRELREELGVAVRLGPEVPGPRDGAWPLGAFGRMRLWWAVITDGTPKPLEDHDLLRWLDAGSWHDVDWLPADIAIVERLSDLASGPHGLEHLGG
ncbi:MAG TPA: (deoxy)nucleoside triphosphate pyrophosphohydrolase [Jiangellaceae bacterium]